MLVTCNIKWVLTKIVYNEFLPNLLADHDYSYREILYGVCVSGLLEIVRSSRCWSRMVVRAIVYGRERIGMLRSARTI